MQGNDVEALRRADGIEYLEFVLPNPYLRDVTLVDTPGTQAVVQEHQNRTAEFLNLRNQLRDRHNQETQRIGSEADAVIYLVGPVSRKTDQAFLEEFTRATGGRSRALNAIGVMAKIDLQPEILGQENGACGQDGRAAQGQPEHRRARLRRHLPDAPAAPRQSQRGIDPLDDDAPTDPPHRLSKLLDDDDLYLGEYEDCPVTVAERRQVLGTMDWGVFTTVARLAADPP